MSYVILDLEWNAAFSKKRRRYLNEIFEFGAVKIDDNLEIEDTFSALVRPIVSTEINPYVAKLTSRTIEKLQDAPHIFETALCEFADFLGDSILMTWSNSDILALMDNKKYFMSSKRLDFMKRYCDLQNYCEYALGVVSNSKKLSLSACAELLSVDVGDRLHSALYDAMLAAECFKKLYKKHLLSEFVEEGDEVYKKLTFKTRVIDNLKSLGSEHKNLYFDCPECKCRCVQKTKWNVRNKCFRAYFVCPDCKKEFSGRVKVKEKYEGVFISKSLTEKKAATPKKP